MKEPQSLNELFAELLIQSASNPIDPLKLLVEQVKQHALDHYTEGWDVIHECYEDEDILHAIAKCQTLDEALAQFSDVIDVHEERRIDAMVSSGCYCGNFPKCIDHEKGSCYNP